MWYSLTIVFTLLTWQQALAPAVSIKLTAFHAIMSWPASSLKVWPWSLFFLKPYSLRPEQQPLLLLFLLLILFTSLWHLMICATLQSPECLVNSQRRNRYNKKMLKHLKNYNRKIWGQWLHQQSIYFISVTCVMSQTTMSSLVEGLISKAMTVKTEKTARIIRQWGLRATRWWQWEWWDNEVWGQQGGGSEVTSSHNICIGHSILY